LHIVEAGATDAPAIILLHGWPQSWAAFERVLPLLAGHMRAIACDLPSIGASRGVPSSATKRVLATYIHALIRKLELGPTLVCGHDIGGQIAYACMRDYPATLTGAVLMNIAIPGIDPWSEVVRNPHIWHFGFHAVPRLPELLVAEHRAAYFDYFFDTLSATADGVPLRQRQVYVDAYARADALTMGFDWYRAFPQDEKDNIRSKGQSLDVPVLCLRGERDPGDPEQYATGLRAAGLRNVRTETIAGSGHFSPDEAPARVADAITRFNDYVRNRAVTSNDGS
jgi:pimeloyl-ACP methyl ester carboxylesterase